MKQNLSGETVQYNKRLVDLNLWPTPLVGQTPAGANAVIGSTAPVAATGTLTSDNTNVSNNDTVTIGGQVYTFKTALTAATTANEVLIGASADASLLNLINAINYTGAPGTDYGSLTTQNTDVYAATSVTAHAFAVTSQYPGTSGNAVATTETSSHLSWGATKLAGGINAALKVQSSADTVTPTFVSVGESASSTIPAGAKGWTITFLTGTGTFGGVAVSAGFSDSDPDILAAAISYTTAAASSAYVRYNS